MTAHRTPWHHDTEEDLSVRVQLPLQNQMHPEEVSCTYLQQWLMLHAEEYSEMKTITSRKDAFSNLYEGYPILIYYLYSS